MLIYQERRPATLQDVSWLRRGLARRLEEMRLSRDIIDDMQLVLSEVGANAVRHGRPAPKTLSVRVDILGAGLKIEIVDDGGPFHGFDVALRRAESSSVDFDDVSGRGLSLVGGALSRLEYQTAETNRFIGWRSLSAARPTVLIVEDDPILMQIYQAYLRSGYKVIASGSLGEAKAVLRGGRVDAVVSDINLGDGQGTTLADEIEARDCDAAPPVVLISSDGSPATREGALRRGAEFFIAKPVREADMLQAVSLALTRTALRRARLARSFARHVDGFANACVPARLGAYRAAVASGTAFTGGDIALHFEAAGAHRIALVDVMGHGIAAKAWAIAYVAIMRTLQQCQPELSAAEFLTSLARFAWSDPSLQNAMATVLIADLDSNGATFASAGHPAPLRVGHVVDLVETAGPLLGVLPPEPYVSARVELADGERFVMITDGVDPAAIVAGDELPWWLRDELLDSRHSPLDVAAAAVRQAAELRLGPRPKDDWTVAIIEKAGDA